MKLSGPIAPESVLLTRAAAFGLQGSRGLCRRPEFQRVPGSGDDQQVVSEVEQVKDACGPAHLKVIVEVDELGGYDHIRHATLLSMEGGADFVKTSTGKVGKGATPSATLVMLEAVRDYVARTGKVVGFKAAGGVRTSKQAIHQLVLVKETLGDEWLTPDRFRIGASSLLNDLLMQYEHGASGRYQRPEDFSKE